ncbi:MAG TPA: 23S rRNA (uracil(1939)-C(5))-methyltransferase RlmD [Acholeplasmatales bacterium]|nr:MAG: 23S rRNA (uracil-5-)-methyltransferase RumA [Tenericutes bacterium GWF2_57_13]HAQ57033.1 23S rRNA (uracil(1939)-C(5))-methyltransferase RlmD [Acholeplasmatales bacterium]
MKKGETMEKANILSVGEIISLDVKKQGINGEGIGYHEQLAVFVPGAIALETVQVEIVDTKPGFAIGRMLSVTKTSEKRVTPPCSYFEKCGGCQMQHIDYAEQLKSKRHLLKQALKRYTTQDPDRIDIRKTIGMKNPFGYRNKAQMPFSNTNFGLALGLYEVNSNRFVQIDECIVQDPVVNAVNKKILTLLTEAKYVAYDHMNREGILLNLITRHMKSTGAVQVTLVVTRKPDGIAAIASKIMHELPQVKSVFLTVNAPKNTSMFGHSIELLQGVPQIEEKIGDYSFKLSPDAFHQLNTDQMLLLYEEIRKAALLTGVERVVDCYSGIGITSILLARQAASVVGIDYAEASVKDAKQNAIANRVKNVVFIQDRVEKALPDLLAKKGVPDVIIFDPPRTGIEDAVIAEVIKAKAPRLVYVSCNPSTLAKNLHDLEAYYNIVYIQPIDMFPHTAGVESLTLLTRKP